MSDTGKDISYILRNPQFYPTNETTIIMISENQCLFSPNNVFLAVWIRTFFPLQRTTSHNIDWIKGLAIVENCKGSFLLQYTVPANQCRFNVGPVSQYYCSLTDPVTYCRHRSTIRTSDNAICLCRTCPDINLYVNTSVTYLSGTSISPFTNNIPTFPEIAIKVSFIKVSKA